MEDAAVLVPGSKVSRQWLIDVMQQHFEQRPEISEVKPLGPEALGYMSTIRRVRLHWQHDGKDLPSSVIVKMPNTAVAAEAWEACSEHGADMSSHSNHILVLMHDCEARVYAKLSEFPEFRIAKPFLFSALPISSGTPIIAMQDFEKSTTVDVVPGFNEHQMLAIVDELAKIHALSFKYPEVKKCGVGIEDFGDTSKFQKLVLGIADQLLKQKPELTWLEIAKRNLLEKDWFSDFWKMSNTDEHSVFCHGDLWCPQVLWRNDSIEAIVDWAICFQGSVVRAHHFAPAVQTVDLLHVIALCVGVELRRQITDQLLQHYHEEARARCAAVAVEYPLSLDEIKADYKRNLPYTAGMTIFATGMWANSPVLKRGDDQDEARIAEVLGRCEAFVQETIDEYGWQ